MADLASYGNPDRDIDLALIALKKGTQLIKYSRKGKPKFCTFRLSPDETTLIWYSHGAERHLTLSSVTRIIPGQRTPVFRRFLRPEKDYLSFSLIYNNGDRSLDLICKDKVESEVWLAGLKALTSTGQLHGTGDTTPPEPRPFAATLEFTSSIPRGRFSTDSNSFAASSSHAASGPTSPNMQLRTSGADGFRISVSSTPSCSSQGSGPDDIESLGDVYLWGEIWSDAVPAKADVLTPRSLETNIVLDVHQIACGVRHIALVTRQGEVFTWGEESGGRLGHGVERDFTRPRLVDSLAVTNVESVSCGEFHTCALSSSGDLYTWGDGTHNVGLLGHGNDVSHWIPKRVSGALEGLQVLSVACGTWHSALATSSGKLFTFGDGMFGALGHGDRESVTYPKEVHSLSGLKTVAVSCGVWHTAAIIEVSGAAGPSAVAASRKLFTWGDGDKYRLGHGSKETYLLPTCVSGLIDYNIQQISCGANMTVALTNSGHVFTMGSNAHGQLGNPQAEGKSPVLVQDRLVGEFVEQISCGSHHVAVLTLRSEVFTWGRGANGRLGHGDAEDRGSPTPVEALKDRHVRNIACGSNYTACICIHKWVSGADQSVCTACRQAFGFTRKRHNCYNCGLVHCHACSSKKAMKAALAPMPGKPHRVCDACYLKLKKAAEAGSQLAINRRQSVHRGSVDFSNRHERPEVRGSRVLLSPTVEPVKYLEIKSGVAGGRSDDYSIVRASQVPSLLQLKDIAFPSSLSALQYALKPVITSGPQQLQQPTTAYQSSSRPASPYSRKPSPPRSAAPVFSRGIKNLKQKSEAQDVEIHKLKETADAANELAADRSSVCVRAMRAVKTIKDQLKEITDKIPPEISESESFKNMQAQVESLLDKIEPQALDDNPTLPPEPLPDQQHNHSSACEANHREDHRTEDSNANGTQQETGDASVSQTQGTSQSSTENGSGTGQREVIEQFEPGVYVTVIQLANGTKLFKRVRFSKRRFDEHQAEEWWKENKDRLLRRYSLARPTKASSAESAANEDSQST
ncbi:regulator of chromosome condensation family protein [Striga asiatica]|uniref:Regulator of chromosome condensation family protein n=1 Tax=Striga asiatica TaxID=4170 RepID=A0A5A7R4F3_STRAF|nr:regulator of chromosome condensation family protein [Striga asiatica]